MVFFGTPAFAVPTLDALLASPHPVVGVVTQPDRPRGRGQKTTDAPVKARAVEAGLPVLQPATLKDPAFQRGAGRPRRRHRRRRRLRQDSVGRGARDAAAGHGQRARVAAAALSRRRAGAPRGHRRRARNRRDHHAGRQGARCRADAGRRFAAPIGADDTSEEVERDLATLGAALLVVDARSDRRAALSQETPQDDSAGDLRATSDQGGWADRLGAAGRTRPQPGSRAASVAARVHVSERRAAHHPPFGGRRGRRRGAAWHHRWRRTATTCASPPEQGILEIVELQAEGKRPMTPRDFLAGHRLTPGDRLTPDAMIAPAQSRGLRHPPGRFGGPRRSAVRHRPRARRRSNDERDRALAAEIATGVQRWRAALDHLIAHFSKRRIDRLDPEIVEILRLSAYQLLHLTRVPAAAVVDDAVDLAGKVGQAERQRPRERRAARRVAQARVAAAAAAAGGSCGSRRPRSTTSASRCRIRAGSPRAGTTGSASRRPNGG